MACYHSADIYVPVSFLDHIFQIKMGTLWSNKSKKSYAENRSHLFAQSLKKKFIKYQFVFCQPVCQKEAECLKLGSLKNLGFYLYGVPF